MNSPPIVTARENHTNAEGNLVSLQVEAGVPDLDPLAFSETGLPAGQSTDPNTGMISGKLAFNMP